MSAVPYIALIASIAALGLAYYFAQVVLAADQGTDLMKEIGQAIQEGAMAFLRREYQWVSAFVAAMFVLLLIVPIDGRPYASFAYLFGAVLSSAAGFVGMRIATEANTRTANAARNGAADALPLAFKGGAVMGFTVAGLALFGITFNYLLWVTWIGVDDAFQVVAAFGLGASSIALFAPYRRRYLPPRPLTSVETSSARSKQVSQRTIHATRPPSPMPWATTSAMSPAWAPISSSRTPARSLLRLYSCRCSHPGSSSTVAASCSTSATSKHSFSSRSSSVHSV